MIKDRLRRSVLLSQAHVVVLVSVFLFGAVHLENIVGLETDPTFALVQAVFAFLGGSGVVAVRHAT